MQSEKKLKTRDLSPYEYFQVLQIEWISADIRFRIYPNKKDKAYWQKVKEGKRQIVETFADKNHLPTIFTDEEMKRVFETRVYQNGGFPQLCYKDEETKKAQLPFDLTYYYFKGSEVRFEQFGEIVVGRIKSYTVGSTTVTVIYNDEEYTLDLEKVTRIL